MNQQDKSFLTTFTTVIAVLVMLAVAIFMVSRLVAVMAAKPDDGSRRLATLTKRIAPIGEVAVAGMPAPSTATGPATTASPAPAPQQVAAAGPASGEAVYNQACAACHTAGVLNAPKYGSKEQWETRYAQGMDTLVTHAVNGINAMPAKGGHPSLTEAEIEASIVYMLEGSGIEVAEATTEVAAAPAEATATPAPPEPAAVPAESAAAPTPAPAQQSEAPAQTAAAPAAPTASAPKAPAPMGASSVQEVTLAASEATNAASQAAAAASQAASAASQAAAAASQAAAAVSQAIDMLREMAIKPAAPPVTEPSAPEPVSAPQSKVEPATPSSATMTKPSAPTAPVAKPAAKTAQPAKPEISKQLHAKPVAPKIPKPAANPTETSTKSVATPAPAPEKPQVPLQEAKPTAPATSPAETAPAPQTESAPAATTAPQQTAAVSAEPEPAAAEPAAIAVEIPPDIHLGRGKQLYNTACVICHQAGVAGAPKLGDKAAWEPRLNQGFDKLVEHSLKGYKGMPPKGGRLDVPDEEIISAVGYMLSELE